MAIFDAPSFPEIKFTSNKIKALGKNKYHVEGVLLMRGSPKQFTLNWCKIMRAKIHGVTIEQVEMPFTIDRTEFGMNWDWTKIFPHK